MSNDNTTNATPEATAPKLPLLTRIGDLAKAGFEKAKKPLAVVGVGVAGIVLYAHHHSIKEINAALGSTYDEDADEFYFAAIEAPPSENATEEESTDE